MRIIEKKLIKLYFVVFISCKDKSYEYERFTEILRSSRDYQRGDIA